MTPALPTATTPSVASEFVLSAASQALATMEQSSDEVMGLLDRLVHLGH